MPYQKAEYDEQGNKLPMSTPSFVHEDRLLSTSPQEKFIRKLSDCARQHYNAVLGEAEKRRRLVKADPLCKETTAIPMTKEGKALRANNFKFLNEKYGFTMDALEKWGNKSKSDSKFIDEHVVYPGHDVKLSG